MKNYPSSSIKEGGIFRLRYLHKIPDSIVIRSPSPYERVDCDFPGWVSLYELPFEKCLRFPFPKQGREVLGHYEIVPSQLMPRAWRLLMSLECLSMKSGIEFGLEELLYSYYLNEHDKE